MDTVEALKVLGETSLETDRALLKLGEALTEKVTHMEEVVSGIRHDVRVLQNQVKDLREKTDLLLAMFNTQVH